MPTTRKPKPARDATPQEMFERVGRVIVPCEAWQAGLTDLMEVGRRTVGQLRTGHLRLRPDHFQTLLRLIAEQQGALQEIEQELREWLARQPVEPAEPEPPPPRT